MVYEDQKLPATILGHDGRHGVMVKLKTPVLKVTVTITKRFLREDLYEKKVELVEELDLYEGYVKPL